MLSGCNPLLGVSPKPCVQGGVRHPDSKQNAGMLLNRVWKPVWPDAHLDGQLRNGLRERHPHGSQTQRAFVSSENACQLESSFNEGQVHKALHSLIRMDQQGIVPSVDFYKTLLQACTKQKALFEAKEVHAHLRKHGLELHRFLGDLLVTTLVSCGGLADGLQLFRRLSYRSVFSWTAVISGYSNAGHFRQAVSCYGQMQQEGVRPDKYTIVSLLKACSKLEDLSEGKRIHADALKLGFHSDIFVCSTLVSMYAKCGSIMDAQQVFDALSQPTVVSWNAMIAAYAQQDQGDKALQIFGRMQQEGVRPNARTLVSTLQACGALAEEEEGIMMYGQQVKVKLQSLQKGKHIHFQVASSGFQSDVFVASSLVSMYAKCGSTMDAQRAFDQLSQRNVVSWNAMIAAYAQEGQGENALTIYDQMRGDGFKPDARTFVSVLQACGTLAGKEGSSEFYGQNVKMASLHKGKAIHVEVSRLGFESDVFVGSSLLSMYAKCGSMVDAREVFDKLSQRSVVSWNAMIAAYVQQNQPHDALQVYDQMLGEGVKPNARTFASALQACCTWTDQENFVSLDNKRFESEVLKKGQEIHAEVTMWGLESDSFVGNVLFRMYAKFGSIKDAEEVFHGLSQRDVVSWTARIAAYAQHNEGGKALQVYAEMEQEGVELDEAAFLCILEVCGSTGALHICVETHRKVVESGFDCSLTVANSLVDAYGKCGSMVNAQDVFDAVAQPDVVSWTALIAGYARQGNYVKSVQCYENMGLSGVKPDGITFLALLSACSHAGMVGSGLTYFESMTKDYGITAELEHYVCMIDLVGRAGLFSNVEDLISNMPMEPTLPVWLALLGACQKHGNVELGRRAFDCAVDLEPGQAAAYLLMLNIYAQARMWDCVKQIDDCRHRAGASKEPGQSWIQHKQEVHTFQVGDHRHQEDLHGLLKELNFDLQQVGYGG